MCVNLAFFFIMNLFYKKKISFWKRGLSWLVFTVSDFLYQYFSKKSFYVYPMVSITFFPTYFYGIKAYKQIKEITRNVNIKSQQS